METHENEQANQMGMGGDSSNQQTDPRTQEQDSSKNDMMSLKSGNMNEDSEENMDEETIEDDEMEDDEMGKDDTMGNGGEMSREDDMRRGTM